MTTTTRPELKPALDRHGRQMSADGGAAKNGLRPMKECTGCGNFVAFVQNAAGRWYLANCYRYANQSEEGNFYYRKDSLHKCSQAAPVAQTEAAKCRATIEEMARKSDGLLGDKFKACALEMIALCETLAMMPDATDDDRGYASRLADILPKLMRSH